MRIDAKMDPKTGIIEQLVGETLFKSQYLMKRRQYRVSSYTPVEGYSKPLHVAHVVDRDEAEEYQKSHFIEFHSIDTAALAIGIEKLQPQIQYHVRKLREDELVADELESLEGYGSF